MTIEMRDSKKPKVIKANYVLQAKAGSGPLDQEKVELCQEVMDNNEIDFTPLGMELITELQNAIEKAKKGETDTNEAVQAMTEPVMQLKANAATFRYTLIGNLANVMLSFLEGIKALDDDAIQIVEAHQRTLNLIIVKKMQGDAGAAGKQMENELRAVCKRYFEKRRQTA